MYRLRQYFLLAVATLLTFFLVTTSSQAWSSCEAKSYGYFCSWGDGYIQVNQWDFFSGQNPARNWFYNAGSTAYANPTPKCVRAGHGGGNVYRQTCDTLHSVSHSYPTCDCGGIYVGTKNAGTGPKEITSYGAH